MHRIIKIAVGTAGLAAAGLMATATAASASVSMENGVGHVDKGDVQSALKWNNGDFDRNVGSLKFTAGYTKTFDNLLTCGANAGDKAGLVEHVLSTSSGTGALKATEIKSSNGKQITGWNLTGAAGSVDGSNDLNAVMQRSFTPCLPDKPISEMTPSELNRQAKWTIDNTGTITIDGLQVNGVSLPNTPTV